MSKLDELVKLLTGLEYRGRSNASIAELAGCDEGLVRRARKESELVALREENTSLKAELARYHRATLPPSRLQARREPFYPLLETFVDGQPVPIVAMLGE